MHTFFINTSASSVMADQSILDIDLINRNLIMLNYPMTDWEDKQKGYAACVKEIGELIDNHAEINNDFNLVIYVDLVALEIYRSLPVNMDNHRSRDACLLALYSVIRNYINQTLVRQLNDYARTPDEVVIVFEENEKPAISLDMSVDADKKLLQQYVARVIGCPDTAELIRLIKETAPGLYEESVHIREMRADEEKQMERIRFAQKVEETDKAVDALAEKLDELSENAPVRVQFGYLKRELLYLLAELSDYPDEQAVESFLFNIYKNNKRSRPPVFCTSFVTNQYAGSKNMSENLKRNLRIYFYLHEGIRSGSFSEPANSNGAPLKKGEKPSVITNRRAKDTCELTNAGWQRVKAYFVEKNRIYRAKLSELNRLQTSFSEMSLVPKLEELDTERLGISFDTDGADAVQTSSVTDKRLFTRDEIPEFDYDGDEFAKRLTEDTDRRHIKPEKYIAAADQLRSFHAGYLRRLYAHFSGVLSGYARRDDDNKPPVLDKRVVNVDDAVNESVETRCRYGKVQSSPDGSKSRVVEKNAAQAYAAAQKAYFAFLASQEVSMADISAQHAWFVEKIKQIRESLKRLVTVGVICLLAATAVYVPYFVIQWEIITVSFESFTSALSSFLIPVLVLCGVFAAVVAWQRSKYRKAWEEFRAKSLEALEENKRSAQHFDRLLTFYIPMLRYVYEFSQDVQFRKECVEIARAKIAHHCEKLRERIELTDKVIDQLQLGKDTGQYAISEKDYEMDYHLAYCSGKHNVELYSVIDSELLRIISEEGVQ